MYPNYNYGKVTDAFGLGVAMWKVTIRHLYVIPVYQLKYF